MMRARVEERGFPQMGAYEQRLKRLIYFLASPCAIRPKNVLEGVAICREVDRHGVPSTLGKFSKAGDDPAQIVREYCLASDSLKDSCDKGSFYLSMKPPSLGFQPEHAEAIAHRAMSNGYRIHFDSHSHDLAQPTLALLERVMAQRFPPSEVPLGWRFSLTLPSRWKRSQADAQWASEMGVRVRLVKGEFRASSSSGETDPREGFLLLVDRLAGHVPEIAVATHDYPLAREAIARCMRSGTHIELELLFGIPAGNMIKLSREMAIPLRFYVPYGDTLLVYGIRHFITYPHKLFRPDALQVISSSSSKVARILESL